MSCGPKRRWSDDLPTGTRIKAVFSFTCFLQRRSHDPFRSSASCVLFSVPVGNPKMTGFSKRTRELVLLRSGGRCERCGWIEGAGQYHHRRPRAMGGSKAADTNTAANCLLLCHYCHTKVESDRDRSLALGLLVHQGKNPSETPVWRLRQWVLLDNYGYITPVEESA